MTGNRAHLEDYQELSKVGSVTFGGSKGSISGKGPDGGFLQYLTVLATRKAAVSEKIATKKTHSPKQPSSTPISNTNPVNTGSDNLNTGFEEVTPGNIEAISPSADHEEEVFSDADDDEMPKIRIYDKSSEGKSQKPLKMKAWVEVCRKNCCCSSFTQEWVLGGIYPMVPKMEAIWLFFALLIYGVYSLSDGCEECILVWTLLKRRFMSSHPPWFCDPDHPKKCNRVTKSRCLDEVLTFFPGLPQQGISKKGSLYVQDLSMLAEITDEVRMSYVSDNLMGMILMYAVGLAFLFSFSKLSCLVGLVIGAANLDRKSTMVGCNFLEGGSIAYGSAKRRHSGYLNKLKWSMNCYEKKLIQVKKIHTDLNVADLLTKAFDGPRYSWLERMLQAQLGHEKGHASCHLLIGCRLVISNDAWLLQLPEPLAGWDQQLNATVDSIEYTLKSQPQPSAAPTPSQPVPTPTPSHVQIPTPPITSTPPSTQPPPLTQSVQLTSSPPSIQPVQSTTPPPQPSSVQLTFFTPHEFKGSQAPPGSKIYRRKPKSTTTPTKVLDFEEPAERPVNTGSTPSAQVNTGSTPSAQVNTGSTPSAELNTDQILAEKIQQEEREQYSIEDRAKFLHDTIAAQRNLKSFGGDPNADNEKEQKAESVHEEDKEVEGAKKRKLGTRRKQKAKRRKYTSGLTREDDDLKICLLIAPDEDKVICVEILDHHIPLLWNKWIVIHLLVENMIPYDKEVAFTLLDLKLETEEESTMALELIKFVKQQLEEFEDSNDDDLAKFDHETAEEQTAACTAWGKDPLNRSVDNLPKIVWYSMHHSIHTKAWLLQSKWLAGKELSNPFIADDLLKIIWLSMYHGLTT
ncbi:hypothetical protein Tco_0102868 [Tanacetum coccineum]